MPRKTKTSPERSRREIVEAVCEHVAQGERIHKACSKEGITWKTLFYWKLEDPELGALYARAREASAHSFEDKGTATVERATTKTVQLARLREDHYRWRAKMANPKEFGDKVDVTSDGKRLGLEQLVAGSMAQKAEPSDP